MRISQRQTTLNLVAFALVGMATGAGAQTANPGAEVRRESIQPAATGTVVPLSRLSVVTQHNDNARTGANLRETVLNTGNVRPPAGGGEGFGKLFSRKVDGQLYAQPLYVSGVTIKGVKRNVIFLATMHNSVYAFDADDPNAGEPLWYTPFLNESKGIKACPIWEVGGWDTNIWPEVGIISTPVIDVANNFLICVTKTKEETPNGVRYPSRLRKLDLRTGKELPGSGIEFAATVPGTGDGANPNGTLSFDPPRHMNRPSLLMMDSVVYTAFGAHSDITPYHGWVFAHDAKFMRPMAVWCSTPNGKTDPSGYPIGGGGIWQSGQGLTADASGNIYLETGNGSFSANTGGVDYGDSFVKIKLNRLVRPMRFDVIDYFTPFDQDWLNRVDADLGVSGPMLVPGTSLLVGGGKAGKLYLLDQKKMGRFNPNGDTQIPQWLWTFPAHLHGSPVFWESPVGPLVYAWSENDKLKAFKLDRTARQLQTTPVATSEMYVPWGMPGGILSLSANGGKAGTGVLWAAHPYDDDAVHKIVPGILRAFDAVTLKELWNSKMVPERDDIGLFAKFTPPTVVNGKVYMASFSGELHVYGIGKWAAAPTIDPPSGEYPRVPNRPLVVRITNNASGATVRYTLDGSDPTPASRAYTGPFSLTQSAVVKARAFATNAQPSAIATARYLIDNGPGQGDGLNGSYFNRIDLTGTPVVRKDGVIDFPNWGGIQPVAGVGPFDFSVRWTGKIQPRASGNYVFSTNSDDGVRLIIDGKTVIDNWTYHAPTVDNGTIFLEEGKLYDIRLDFFQGGGGAVIQLFWSSEFIGRQIVPQSQLHSGN
ncbi:MAG: PA14 domain-containing protein [Capsulimonadales bacterium]|nr:PA14 domain-containing protein [Capsulimonadales bacterium]